MLPDVTVIDLPYLAPVPAGHDVAVLKIARADAGFFESGEVECVVDRATRIVYADRAYLNALAQSPVPAYPADAPADALGPGWSVQRSFMGQVVCAVLSTADATSNSAARTRLYVRSAPPTTYR